MRILEFAYSRQKAKEIITNVTQERYEHLLLVYFYPNHSAYQHWFHELYSLCNKFPRIKSSNKLLDRNVLYKILWEEPKETYVDKDAIDRAIYYFSEIKGLPEIKDVNYVEVYNYLKDFHEWLSYQLSNTKSALLNAKDFKRMLSQYIED